MIRDIVHRAENHIHIGHNRKRWFARTPDGDWAVCATGKLVDPEDIANALQKEIADDVPVCVCVDDHMVIRPSQVGLGAKISNGILPPIERLRSFALASRCIQAPMEILGEEIIEVFDFLNGLLLRPRDLATKIQKLPANVGEFREHRAKWDEGLTLELLNGNNNFESDGHIYACVLEGEEWNQHDRNTDFHYYHHRDAMESRVRAHIACNSHFIVGTNGAIYRPYVPQLIEWILASRHQSPSMSRECAVTVLQEVNQSLTALQRTWLKWVIAE